MTCILFHTCLTSNEIHFHSENLLHKVAHTLKHDQNMYVCFTCTGKCD